MDQVVKLEMNERQQCKEALTQQEARETLAGIVPEVMAIASGLQLEVVKLEKKIRSTTKPNNRDVQNLVKKLKDLRTPQQRLVVDQKALAKKQGNNDLLHTARELSELPFLVSALVIGFDMESEGLPSALARIFRRVSGAVSYCTTPSARMYIRTYHMIG